MTRIVCQQLAPVLGDLEANAELTIAAITAAIDAGADVVVLPELATSGYMFDSMEEAAAVAIRRMHSRGSATTTRSASWPIRMTPGDPSPARA
jgi:predicted amidohydrolase